jgi:DNA-binding transcriptional ArsR family regulator
VKPRPDPEVRAGLVFEALADPTRRAVLRQVAERGPRTATELAADLPVSRQAVAKHLGVLHEAGLVSSAREGREMRFTARLEPLADTQAWLAATGAAWDRRLARLEALAADDHQPGEGPTARR